LKVRRSLWLFASLLAVLVLVAASCGGDDDEGAGGTDTGQAGGEGKTLKIVSDLPLQGSDRVQTTQMNEAIKFVLEQAGNKAGPHTIEFEEFDDATAAKGAWDEAKCAENARTYAETEEIVGVIGTYNSSSSSAQASYFALRQR
jgi:branched-chain amino acid transport system substrate-binding protein